MKKNQENRGFMQIVFLAIVVIASLAYFNVDLHTLVQNPIAQKIFSILYGAWVDYLFPLFKYLRENVLNLVGTLGSMATSTATTTAQVLGK